MCEKGNTTINKLNDYSFVYLKGESLWLELRWLKFFSKFRIVESFYSLHEQRENCFYISELRCIDVALNTIQTYKHTNKQDLCSM